jgi:hypothetical protein
MTTYADLTKGPAWEYRVMRAAFLSGWYVRRGVNLRERVRGSPQTMAEVDILGFGFDPALATIMLVGECKDRKGGTKEADRVTWLLGLSRILRANHALFAKPKLTDATIQFADPLGLILWDQAAVRSIEQRFGLAIDSDFFGSSNIALQEDILRPSRKASAIKDRGFRAAWDYISGAFWYQSTPARTKRLAGYFRALAEAQSVSGEARSGFVAEGLMALLASAYTTAGHLARLSPARADVQQETAFASGAADARTLREIAARADDYYQDALNRAAHAAPGAVASEIRVPRLVNTIAETPNWMPAYIAFARRLGERPLLAGDVLRYADLLLFEHLLAGNEMPEPTSLGISSDHAGFRTVIDLGALFLQRIWGTSDPLLDKILASQPLLGSRKRGKVSAARDATLFEVLASP